MAKSHTFEGGKTNAEFRQDTCQDTCLLEICKSFPVELAGEELSSSPTAAVAVALLLLPLPRLPLLDL
jgi:hypothetical protein